MATMFGLQKYNTGGLVNWWETKEKSSIGIQENSRNKEKMTDLRSQKSSCFLNLTNYNCEQFTYTHNGHKCQCNLGVLIISFSFSFLR